MSDPTPPPAVDVGSYAEIEAEVAKHFAGDWQQFLKAVENPAEVLHFVLVHLGKDTEAFERWAKDKELPPDWVPRFYSTLDADGELKTSSPS